MRALAIADTHVDERGVDGLLARLDDELSAADVILHAGDVTTSTLLDVLENFAPVHAVRGNNDRGLARPDRLTVELDGTLVAMVHDSGAAAGRAARLRRWFPIADVVVFGHSHLPWHETHVEGRHVQHHINPGSPTLRRRAPRCTVAWLELTDGEVRSVTHVPVG